MNLYFSIRQLKKQSNNTGQQLFTFQYSFFSFQYVVGFLLVKHSYYSQKLREAIKKLT